MSRSVLIACLLTAAAVAVAHGPAVQHEFVAFDDDIYVYGNSNVQQGLTVDSVRSAFRLNQPRTYFHPLTWLSLMADRQILGPDPRGFHAVNVAMHALVAILLLLVLAEASGRVWPAAAAAVLFAVHPLTVESVAWVSERKTVLSGTLGMAAVLAYVRYAARPSAWRMLVVCGLLVASMLAKPTFVVLPGLLLLMDVWPLRRWGVDGGAAGGRFASRSPLRLVLEKVPLGFAGLAVLWPIVVSTQGLPALSPPIAVRAANAVAAVTNYVSAVFWPSDLAPYHLYRAVVAVGPTILGAGVAAVLVALAVAAFHKLPAVSFGLAWFLLAILPQLGFRQAGMWPAWADRFAYIPLMGMMVGLAYAAADLAVRSKRWRTLVTTGALAATMVLIIATRTQVAHWRDSLSLFERVVSVEPKATVMRVNLGGALVHTGRFAEARLVLTGALQDNPYSSLGFGFLGMAQAGLGMGAEAEMSFIRALQLDPGAMDPLMGLADLYYAAGQKERAASYYLRFVARAGTGQEQPRARALSRLQQ